ncbi:MAG: hypothetical protein KTR20_00365 [Cellvibrionaceae bacterium]|nr:hypothetical protein [Cellvibrionaceae bacterium]
MQKNIQTPLSYCVLLLMSLGHSAAAESWLSMNNTGDTSSFSLELRAHSWDAQASWNTASDISGTTTPNVLSELDYDKIRIRPLSIVGELRMAVYDSYMRLGFEALGGDIDSGATRDSDYGGDDRSGEWSRSHADITGDSVSSYNAYMGWLADGEIGLSLLLGYQRSEQTLRIQNGVQLVCVAPCGGSLGAFSDLNSVYQMTWQGPWLGLGLSERSGAHQLLVDYEYHFGTVYRGQAEWNLRTDLQQPQSFVHNANGKGQRVRLGYHYYINTRWRLSAVYQRLRWRTDPGLQTRYFADNTVGTIRLNRAEWKAQSYALGVQLSF